MAAYHRVYDSRHCRLTAMNRDQLQNPMLGNLVIGFFLFEILPDFHFLEMLLNII